MHWKTPSADAPSVGLVSSQTTVGDVAGEGTLEYCIPGNLKYMEGLHGQFDLKRAQVPPPAAPPSEESEHVNGTIEGVFQVSDEYEAPMDRSIQKESERTKTALNDAHRQNVRRLLAILFQEEADMRPMQTLDGNDSDRVLTQQLETPMDGPSALQNMNLLRGKVLKMQVKREYDLARQQTPAANNQDIVRCQCGHPEEEGAMMQCECCDTWQHQHCYGYLHQSPGKEHFCYQCLLEDRDESRLDDLKRLAQVRRTLFILYEKEPPSQTAFMRLLGLGSKTTKELMGRLEREGFLHKTPGTTLSLVKTAEQRSLQLRAYFNPLTYIAHNFEPVEPSASPLSQPDSDTRRRKRIRVK
ncbi:hypothetical protein ACLMJK_005421 [Lecanora helva]